MHAAILSPPPKKNAIKLAIIARKINNHLEMEEEHEHEFVRKETRKQTTKMKNEKKNTCKWKKNMNGLWLTAVKAT
jgi:hypothetical protein